MLTKAVVAAFNQEKARVGAFSVITNLWMELFERENKNGKWMVHSEVGGLLVAGLHFAVTIVMSLHNTTLYNNAHRHDSTSCPVSFDHVEIKHLPGRHQ